MLVRIESLIQFLQQLLLILFVLGLDICHKSVHFVANVLSQLQIESMNFVIRYAVDE